MNTQTPISAYYDHYVSSVLGISVDRVVGARHTSGMEPRIAKLEAAVDHIQRDISDVRADVRQLRGDVRTQLYWVLGGFAAVLTVLAKGFGWL